MGLNDTRFTGLSCSKNTSCTAVGTYLSNSGNFLTLVEVWNGARWMIVPTPNPTGAVDAVLNGVTCTGASFCAAVGASGGTLAEQWNGSAWTLVPTPDP
jgi:hypothetical protein